MDFYTALAPYYDQLFALDAAVPALLAANGMLAGRLIDVGCGTGLLPAFLLGTVADSAETVGVDVWGTDLSQRMIEQGRRREAAAGRPTNRLAVGDMRAVAEHPMAPFDAIVCVGNSLAHLPSSADARGFCATLAAALRGTGCRVLLQFVDVANIAVGSTKVLPTQHAAGSGTLPPAVLHRFYHRESEQLVRFEAHLKMDGDQHELHTEQPLLVLSSEAVVLWLQQAGFSVISVAAGFRGETITNDTWVRVIVAERTGGS